MPTRRSLRVSPFLAVLVIGIVLVSSLGLVVAGFSLGPLVSSGGSPLPAATVTRDPLLWPFAKNSIWNLPIGANARYGPANIAWASSGMTTDVDVLILTPNAAVTPIYYNSDAWNVIPGRCGVEGGVLFSAPIPSNFVVLGNG